MGNIEQWKKVNGYGGAYEVSNTGRVRSIDRIVAHGSNGVYHRKGKELAKNKNRDGYLTVHLSSDGIDEHKPIHVLVAEAFVDGWFDGAEVNHIDFDRTNNNADNLEWISHHDNVMYTISNGRHVCQRDLRGVNNPNYGNRTLSAKYADNPEYAKEKQGRPGLLNGRATPVRAFFDGIVMDFDYFVQCAAYMIDHNMVRSKDTTGVSAYISRAAKNGSKYFGYRFELI